MKKLIAWIARILLDPSLVYWAQFSISDWQMVQVNKISAGPLLVVTTGTNGLIPQTPLQPPDSGGVVFRATKDPDPAADVVSMVALSPLPTGLPQRFTLVADFYLPPEIGPWPVGVQWAATVGIRNDDNPDAGRLRLVGATQQFRNLVTDTNPGSVRIALGAGNGTTPGTTTPAIDLTDIPVAYPDARRHFTLETDIDRDQGTGRSRLRTPGKIWAERTWEFDAGVFPQITGVGFGQAFISGAGAATVTATAFHIYSFNRWNWLTSLLLGLRFDAAA
jgi:hypothetical protein